MAALANSHNQHPNEHVRLRENINKYKEESEKVHIYSVHELSNTYSLLPLIYRRSSRCVSSNASCLHQIHSLIERHRYSSSQYA